MSKDTLTAHYNQSRYDEDWARFVMHTRYQPNHRARLASALVERWGMVAGEVDGEASTGRAQMRLQTPEELVTRACDPAERLYAELERRDWLVDIGELPKREKRGDNG